MALIVYWYDFICFAIVAAAIVTSLWFLLRRERGCLIIDDTAHSSLLLMYRSKSLDSAQLWTTCWRRLHPGWLLFTRSTSFLSMAALLAWDVMKWDASIFVYYTEWTFMLVIIYFAMGIVASVYGCLTYSKELMHESGEDAVVEKLRVEYRQSLGVYGCFMQTIFQTSAGAVVLTDIVFWLVIVPFLSNTHFGLNTLMICMHTANAGFLLLETALNSLISAVPLVSNGIFRAMELSLCCFPMDHPRLWLHLVAISVPRARQGMGSNMVFVHGNCSHPLLWSLCRNCKSKEYKLPLSIPKCFCKATILIITLKSL